MDKGEVRGKVDRGGGWRRGRGREVGEGGEGDERRRRAS